MFQDADAKNEGDAGDFIKAGEDGMVLEDDPNDDSVTEAIAEAAEETELECIAEVAEENEGVLACHPKCHRNPGQSLQQRHADSELFTAM